MNGGLRVESREGEQMHASCQTEVEVKHGVGLHARPSVTFTRLAKSFPCSIEVAINGSDVWLNGKSIIKIMVGFWEQKIFELV